MPASQKSSPVRVALYLRQSQDRTGDGLAVERQETFCRTWLEVSKHAGAEIVKVYTDNDISATKRGVRRPQFEAMLADAQAGQFDLILAYHLDRLTRTLRDLLPLLDLATNYNVGSTLASGDVDLTSDVGRLVATILASVAQHEIDRKKARQLLSNEQRAAKGLPHKGGHRAFGYEADGMTVREGEAAIMVKLYDEFLANVSLAALTRDLNERGVRTSTGGAWREKGVRDTLLNARYAGIHTRLGEETGPAAWPALVPELTYRATVAKLSDPTRRASRGRRPGSGSRRLLTGVAQCGRCADGTTVNGAMGGKHNGFEELYACSVHPGHLRRRGFFFDEFATRLVVEKLSRPDAINLVFAADKGDNERLLVERQRELRRREEGQAAFSAGLISMQQLIGINADSDRNVKALDTQLAQHSHNVELAAVVGKANVALAFAALPVERKQGILKALASWTINPGKRGRPAGPPREPEDFGFEIIWHEEASAAGAVA